MPEVRNCRATKVFSGVAVIARRKLLTSGTGVLPGLGPPGVKSTRVSLSLWSVDGLGADRPVLRQRDAAAEREGQQHQDRGTGPATSGGHGVPAFRPLARRSNRS